MMEEWTEAEASFERLFGHERVTPDPDVLPRGSNFMTPDVLGYIERDGTTVEISTGPGLDPRERLYGVTFCEWDPDGSWAASNRSRCCQSWQEVLETANA